MMKTIGVLGLIGLLFAGPRVWAQPAAPAPGTGDQKAGSAIDSQIGEAVLQTEAILRLPKGGEAVVETKLLGVVNPPSGVSFEGVRFEGYGRRVNTGSRDVGQMVWSQVSKIVDGKERTAVLDSAWATQVVMEGDTVPAELRLSAGGDMAALVKAVQQLNDLDVEEPEEEEEKKVLENDPRGGSYGRSTGSSENDIAGEYQPLESTQPKIQTETVVAETTIVTTAGCDVRVDETQGVAIVQSKEVTSGASGTSETACSDSEVRYLLQRSYARCSDKIDLSEMAAWPQYITYYVDSGGTTHDTGECVPDLEQEFEIVENKTGCAVYTDWSTITAQEQASLVYTNQNNSQVTVRGCEPVGTPVAITWTDAGCSIRHDFGANRSVLMEKAVFTLNGKTYTAQECTDRGVFYPHETVATVDGIKVCADIVALADMRVYPQTRTRINVNGAYQWIGDCTPDTNAAIDLVATHDGCSFVHDEPANVSYEEHRYYYLEGGVRTYVNNCSSSGVIYTHQVEGGAVHGYVNHDTQRFSYENTALYIDTPYGRIEVSAGQVREGAPQIAYIWLREETVETGQQSFEGCNTYTLTALNDVYQRPDGTEYTDSTGVAGTPVGPEDTCENILVDSRDLKSGGAAIFLSSWTFNLNGDTFMRQCNFAYYDTFATVEKRAMTNTASGVVISTTCGYFDLNGNGNTEDDFDGWRTFRSNGNFNVQVYRECGASSSSSQTLYVGQSAASHNQPACPF